MPPTPFGELEPIIREDLGDVFARIDPERLATASIAQIQAALLRDGREVVVKVRCTVPACWSRSGVDLELLRSTAAAAQKRSETARLLQLSALAAEVETNLRAELDFEEEAATSS